ncbi:hypothetical protein LCGC14_2616900, partial [marine sediment metagenome]
RATEEEYKNRFEGRFAKRSSGCWEWSGKLCEGYGQMGYHGRPVFAHRVSWMLYKSRIPIGKMVLHKCNNRSCVNPDHLYIGTAKDNSRDAIEAGSSIGCGQGVKKLTETMVLEIRDMLELGTPQWLIAQTYNVNRSAICAIKTGKAWSHVA